MNPTENLTREHKDIKELLNIMNKIADQIKSNQVFYTNDVEDILDFLLDFIEHSHHRKEEIFYPELVSAGIPKETESISIMLYEHALSRNYLKEISSCVQNCKIGNDFSGDLLADSLIKYVTLLKGHIKKEERIIFPMAEKELSEEKQHEIYAQFEYIDKKVVGEGIHEHYHKLLQKLKYNSFHQVWMTFLFNLYKPINLISVSSLHEALILLLGFNVGLNSKKWHILSPYHIRFNFY